MILKMQNFCRHLSPPPRGGRVGHLFLSLLFSTIVMAQPFDIKKKVADRYYDRFEYYKAIPMYLELHNEQPNNFDIIQNLAGAYYRINDSKHAEFWLRLITDSMPADTLAVLRYAQVLARNSKYNLAKQYYENYAALKPDDPVGNAFSLAYNDMSWFYSDSASVAIRSLPFNSPFSDFSPIYFKNELVYASAREKQGIIRLWYSWTNSSYLDLYQVHPDSAQAKVFMPGLHSLYHEGPVAFNKTFDTIYFTRSNFYNLIFRKSEKKVNKLNIFQAVWDSASNDWINITPLPFNSKHFSCGHPALSGNGSVLYFVSDMPGGYGGTDIYFSKKQTDSLGKSYWATPVNLDSTINTSQNEMFPYIDSRGNLYFASNGHPGLGGLDVFVANASDMGFENPVNLKAPINSHYDDFGFIISPSGKDGYFSSDRFNDPGNDDVYRWKKISRNLLILAIDSKTKAPLANVKVGVNAEGTDPLQLTTNDLGLAPLVVKPSVSYNFKAHRDKYLDSELILNQQQIAELDTIKIALEKRIPKFNLTGKVYAEDDKKPFVNAEAYLINKQDSSQLAAITDNSGSFNFELQPGTDYKVMVKITAQGKKCSANTIDVSTVGLDYDNNFVEMFPVLCVGDVIRIDNIYYDLGKWNIRDDAAIELNKVVEIMKKYPKMRIELRSHTDSRGSDAANMALSDKRAKAAAAYLASQGIDENRIIGKGYGESIPINKCTNGVKCSEEEFQVNRRTEFKILSIE